MSAPDTDRHTLATRRASLMVLAIFATLGVLMGIVAAGDNVLAVDVRVLETIQQGDLPGLDLVVRLSNAAFGTAGALVLAVGLITTAAALFKLRVFMVQMAVVIVLRLAGQVLKPIFESPRPGIEHQPDPSLVSHTFGYPSGHAYTATIMMVMFMLFAHALDAPRWVRGASIAVAVLGTAIALFSRVWVGAHWPTDTIGGVFFGLATVALMQLIVAAIPQVRSSARAQAEPAP